MKIEYEMNEDEIAYLAASIDFVTCMLPDINTMNEDNRKKLDIINSFKDYLYLKINSSLVDLINGIDIEQYE